jgi:hypothetical protein
MRRLLVAMVLVLPFLPQSGADEVTDRCMLLFSDRRSMGFDDPTDPAPMAQNTAEQLAAMMSPAAYCRLESQRANNGVTPCKVKVDLVAIAVNDANELWPEYSFDFTTRPMDAAPTVTRLPATGNIDFSGEGEIPSSEWDTDGTNDSHFLLFDGTSGLSYDHSEVRLQLDATEHDNGPTALIDADDHSSSLVKRAYIFPCIGGGMANRMMVANRPVGTDVDVTFFIDIHFAA